jgi:hypothetical protein
MRFHALLLVRDEADIIEESLRHLVTWADAIYVFDTGSEDPTWDVVQQLAVEHRCIKPLVQDAVFFSEKRLRGWLFQQARKNMHEGDWFARVDADEFHHVPPPEFVRTRLRRHETVVYHQYYDFRLARAEAAAWARGEVTDANKTVQERRRWFTLSSYTEPRLCRYRASMRWPETVSFPYNAGFVAAERLPIRHYPHRDPAQLKRRCRLRALMMAEPENICNTHWRIADWERLLADDDDPGLHYWNPGTELPEPRFRNHLTTPPVRFLQRVIHATALPVLDRCRKGYSESIYPAPIPRTLQEELSRDLQWPGGRSTW